MELFDSLVAAAYLGEEPSILLLTRYEWNVGEFRPYYDSFLFGEWVAIQSEQYQTGLFVASLEIGDLYKRHSRKVTDPEGVTLMNLSPMVFIDVQHLRWKYHLHVRSLVEQILFDREVVQREFAQWVLQDPLLVKAAKPLFWIPKMQEQ